MATAVRGLAENIRPADTVTSESVQAGAAMRVVYDWTESDWNEAVTLATEAPRRRGSVPGTVYALIGIPLIGAVMDGVRSVRGTGKLTGAGLAVPLLLVALAAVLAAGLFTAHLQRRRRVRSQLPMPTGQWEAVLQEAGWRFSARPEGAGGVPVVPVIAAAADTPVIAISTATQAGESTPGEVVAVIPPAADADSIAAEASTSAAQAPAVATPESAIDASPVPVPDPAEPTAANDVKAAEPVKSEDGAKNTPALPANTEVDLKPWKKLTGSRAGDHVMVFLHKHGFHAVPIRCMTPDQASHLHRMVIRKLRPMPPTVPPAAPPER